MRNRDTGALTTIDICDIARFRDGLLVEFAEHPDSAALARLEAGA
jgi:ketosteroid isomerase-like protein